MAICLSFTAATVAANYQPDNSETAWKWPWEKPTNPKGIKVPTHG